jgi:hypothetical protein
VPLAAVLVPLAAVLVPLDAVLVPLAADRLIDELINYAFQPDTTA